MSVNQNVPSCVGGRDQQRLPPESRLREQQPVLIGGRTPTITACTCRLSSARRVGQLSRQLLVFEGDEQRR
jgi:hypothetical protein